MGNIFVDNKKIKVSSMAADLGKALQRCILCSPAYRELKIKQLSAKPK
jgi:hypothetical protein